MYKLFSIDQANSLIPQVDRKLEELKAASADLRGIAKRIKRLEPFTIEARNLYFESTFLAQQLHGLKAELTELGLQVADPETGKLGFPGQIGAELVYLTWEPGERTVSHFRRLAGGEERAIPLEPSLSTGQGSASA